MDNASNYNSFNIRKDPKLILGKSDIYHKASTEKTIKLLVEGHLCNISIPKSVVTCRWLLNQAKIYFNKICHKEEDRERQIIAIESEGGNETLDFYLTQLDR